MSVKHWFHDIGNMEEYIPDGKDKFIAELDPWMKEILRPIAETLAMLDGNAFFGMEGRSDIGTEWYEQYLPEAFCLFESNGGLNGWAGEMQHVRWRKMIKENKTATEHFKQLQILLTLLGNDELQ